MKALNMRDYDEGNVFNKILKNIIKCVKIDEDQNNLSFEDLNKQAPVHVLTIPKNKYSNFTSFVTLSMFSTFPFDSKLEK